ncbi:MAG TPA: GNAT family N-acetyltransferase [Leptolyngbyaceae cyanobacterium M33_DOE_097]|uniref:GNAT family N-acetyltransferase n=1 Tax=Oscillatoriales cyanobacterium SpSt-418 TaxID=2282169 RepID=A0A7C3KFK1_9CYAN|nr:GNAT family N-acetyltransferase [Leptolyngbyaceae cyanobacterium M33_DOE_097]
MLTIQPLQSEQIAAVKQMIMTVWSEIWGDVLTPAEIRELDDMQDINHARSHYFDNGGTFLVLLEAEQVVGTGAIRKLDDAICELKRMWLLQAYRGRGWGQQLADQLLDFAYQAGYQKVRLDLADAQRQAPALNFYQKLGFYPIDRYNNGLCTVFMEKALAKT